MKRVTQIMGEITTASREQSLGIEQENQAIAQMDQVTQQNAAMVEQAVAVAGSLKAQSEDLSSTVGVFMLKETSHGSADEAVAMVERTFASLAENGREATFTDVNSKLSRFRDRDLYVIVYDMNGRNVAHGAKLDSIGQNLLNKKDEDGRL